MSFIGYSLTPQLNILDDINQGVRRKYIINGSNFCSFWITEIIELIWSNRERWMHETSQSSLDWINLARNLAKIFDSWKFNFQLLLRLNWVLARSRGNEVHY